MQFFFNIASQLSRHESLQGEKNKKKTERINQFDHPRHTLKSDLSYKSFQVSKIWNNLPKTRLLAFLPRKKKARGEKRKEKDEEEVGRRGAGE